MKPMTSRERIARTFQHRETDRIPIVDKPWGQDTIGRWIADGMPPDADYRDYFGFDKIIRFDIDNSPRFQKKTLEETPAYRIYTTAWGETRKSWRHITSTPQSLDFVVRTPDDWRRAKARMRPDRDRIQWEHLRASYRRWRQEGAFIMPSICFGFDITHSYMLGMETMLIALVEDPEWCREMFEHQLVTALALLEQVWDAGYVFDALRWPDDMGFKGKQFFSLQTYRDILKPLQRRVIDWAHAKGIPAYLHSCGNIEPFIPELVEIGLDALNPIEVKAGMDPLAIKRAYGDKLVLHGGMNVMLWDHLDEMERVVRQQLPILKKNGGYIFATDHSIPATVSAADLQRILAVVREEGRY
jgi:uroporphyrinogen decarboxylase